jgi:RecA-family ATPase
MAINLLGLQPHKVSRDLSGYITFIYGPPKVGKTTLATQMPGALLLAFERGYNAIPGIIAQDVNTWGEMKQIFRELKKPEVQEVYKTIIVDTVDIAADLCQKYICNQLGIDNMGDGGWGTNSWSKYKKEFEDVFRGLTMMGYAVVFISHSKTGTDKDQTGKEFGYTKPTTQSSALQIIENMADIYCFARMYLGADGEEKRVLTLRSPAGSGISCGSRFKYIASEIPLNYDALTKAIGDAIDKEAKENGNKFVTNEREAAPVIKEYDFDALMAQFETMVGDLMTKDQTYYAPRITQVIEKYLGKGKKMSGVTRDQAELVYLVVTEIQDDLVNGEKK